MADDKNKAQFAQARAEKAKKKAGVVKVPARKGDYARLQRALQHTAEASTIVLFCSDSAGQRGTKNRAKYDSDRHMRKRGM